MKAVFDAAKEHQLQVVADVVVHGHVVADYVNVQRAKTFADGLLLISRVTRGDFGNRIVGEKATETCHDLGVISVYIIGHDDFLHLRRLKHLHHIQGRGTAFPHGRA